MKNILSVIFVITAGVVSTLDAKPALNATRTTETCGDPTLAVPFYRAYNPTVANHAYGMDLASMLKTNPWTYQALAAFVFATQEESTIPLHHMVNPTTFDRIYTTNPTEPLYYIYPTQICGSVPFYRLSKLALHDHFFIASETERIEYIESQGYSDEGIAGYVFAPEPSQC
ncbi:hypothetical protein DFH09DRAFT_1148793 [Mycena vulgaris]|nr:hypothetical protein DFH09DRAFT_1148793 [Mycena vulgaris]